MSEFKKPYVVSGDVQLLVQEWSQRRGFVAPKTTFFYGAIAEFGNKMKSIFPTYEYVPAEVMRFGIAKLTREAEKDGLTPVALDRVYCQTRLNLGVSRAVDNTLANCGLSPRKGCSPLKTQYDAIEAAIKDQPRGSRSVALIDDVVFSGGVILEVRQELTERGIEIPRVCAGIVVDEGIESLSCQNIELAAVKSYPMGVIDEVCERDFFPGVPFSGRTYQADPEYGMPYILPYGNPSSWASVPNEKVADFSVFCNEQAARLYEEIGRLSKRPVTMADLDRKIYGLGVDTSEPVAYILRRIAGSVGK